LTHQNTEILKIRDAYQKILQTALLYYTDSEAQNIARIILEDVYQCTNPNKDAELPLNTPSIESICQKIANKEPVQYITGIAFFYELSFLVTPDVLIPRPETEELVYQILHKSALKRDNISIIDIGTGSGCIPLSLKHKKQGWNVYATDVSKSALEIAKKNALRHDMAIEFVHHDILDRNNWQELPMFDVIVSNPPYITENEQNVMPDHVLEWEPHLALFSGGSALLFYETIADFGLEHLNKNGILFFEINEFHGQATLDMLVSKGYKNVKLVKDMSDRDRIISAEI
jgi:release factor glutamine methyltransferase